MSHRSSQRPQRVNGCTAPKAVPPAVRKRPKTYIKSTKRAMLGQPAFPRPHLRETDLVRRRGQTTLRILLGLHSDGLPSSKAASSRKAASMKRTTLGSSAARWSVEYGASILTIRMRGAEEDALQRLFTHPAGLSLDTVSGEHVAHARIDQPGGARGPPRSFHRQPVMTGDTSSPRA